MNTNLLLLLHIIGAYESRQFQISTQKQKSHVNYVKRVEIGAQGSEKEMQYLRLVLEL
jgi:hypothetical protein